MEWQIENDRPIYAQLIEQIERAVVAGDYSPGDKLPGVREMAAQAGVNPNTMQRALAELEVRGLLQTQRTSGRFVTQDANEIARLREMLATQTTTDYVHRMRGLGCTLEVIKGYIERVKEA